jgi:inosine-uridine nucleoside N-ribohydrolase
VPRIHLDTDLGSDTDDLCALALLLGWPGVDLVGVTTVTDPDGRRAGWVRHALELAGRRDVPVAAGASATLGELAIPLAFPAYWPERVPAAPSPPGAALDLLAAAATNDATIVTIGPLTNLALLEVARPGLARAAGVVTMGGHVPPPEPGFPPWGADDDVNLQQDAVAATIVLERCDPLLVPLSACMRVALRASHLRRLRAGGALPRLIADQAEWHARDNDRRALAAAHPALPDDLLNLQYDPLACAVAAGWDGVAIEPLPIAVAMRGSTLHMSLGGDRTIRTVVDVDGPAFEAAWLDAVLRMSTP